MERTERIIAMESALDRVGDAIAGLEAALEAYSAIQKDIRVLLEYAQSDLWMEDSDADREGQLPADLKRGVLSQDGISDMMEANAAVIERMAQIIMDNGRIT